MGGFTGFDAMAFEFYDRLAADPTKSWWEANREDYQRYVRAPMLELAEQMEPEFGPVKLFRPYRDVRFSRDKTPYKDHQGMFAESSEGVGWYLQVSATGLMVAGGWYSATGDQVQAFRAAVDDPDGATEFRSILADVEASGLMVSGDRLKTRPRGVPADHPNLDLLRYRSVIAERSWPAGPELGEPGVAELVVENWRAMRPMTAWLTVAVGGPDGS